MSTTNTSSDGGCPDCGAGIQFIATREPGDAVAQPCGCQIGYIPASKLRGGADE